MDSDLHECSPLTGHIIMKHLFASALALQLERISALNTQFTMRINAPFQLMADSGQHEGCGHLLPPPRHPSRKPGHRVMVKDHLAFNRLVLRVGTGTMRADYASTPEAANLRNTSGLSASTGPLAAGRSKARRPKFAAQMNERKFLWC